MTPSSHAYTPVWCSFLALQLWSHMINTIIIVNIITSSTFKKLIIFNNLPNVSRFQPPYPFAHTHPFQKSWINPPLTTSTCTVVISRIKQKTYQGKARMVCLFKSSKNSPTSCLSRVFKTRDISTGYGNKFTINTIKRCGCM